MMKTLFGKIFLFAAFLAIAGCGKGPVASQDVASNEILAVIRTQTDALNHKDLAAYLATIDPESPAFEKTKEMIGQMFEAYELRYTLKEVRVESVSGDEARVHFDQTTEKISGLDFRNNHIEGVHLLKKRNGAWKFTGTQISEIEYLDK